MSHIPVAIESALRETRRFEPSPAFAANAWINSPEQYQRLYQHSIEQPEEFWDCIARELHWFTPWESVLEWQPPYAKWFLGGQLNASYNCLDVQIERGRGDKTAILWEGELVDMAGQPQVRRISYRQLQQQVCRFANGLKKLGVKKGDRVTIYLPLVPEAAVAMLACARLGAVHSVVFGGFSSQAILDRIEDAGSSLVITADGGHRRGHIVPLKYNVDEAAKQTNQIRHIVVLKHTGQSISMTEGRDIWWHDLIADVNADCPAEPMDSEDTLFVLYTSGSTGKPKGIVHSTGGYLVGTYITAKYVFDLHEDDIYWCTADVGWVTGHSYLVYGLLSNGATVFMYEGAPNYPDFARFWSIIERHKISVFYTAPTAIRAFMRAGRQFADQHDLSSLRLLGSVGEPINPEAWMWYHQVIGRGECPIVDTWWQTETGMIMISPLPGLTATKPGSATLPFFGVDTAVVDRTGQELPANTGGLLVIRKPWPAMLRGILNDPDRYVRQYWSDVGGAYFTGDGARRDEEGYFWVMGRVDDVLNVGGHRLGTAEIESALVSHDDVAEAAVVGMPHDIKGQGIAAFVTLRSGVRPSEKLRQELIERVVRQIGSIARLDQLRFTDALPKTRSGKIMRRLLKDLAAGSEVQGDTTTLEDFAVLARLKEQEGA